MPNPQCLLKDETIIFSWFKRNKYIYSIFCLFYYDSIIIFKKATKYPVNVYNTTWWEVQEI